MNIDREGFEKYLTEKISKMYKHKIVNLSIKETDVEGIFDVYWKNSLKIDNKYKYTMWSEVFDYSEYINHKNDILIEKMEHILSINT